MIHPTRHVKKKRKLTEEESIILELWLQFGIRFGRKRQGIWAGGYSSLEDAEMYLKGHKIINLLGNTRPEIEW